MPSCEVNFRVGGKYRLCLRGFGQDHWVNGEYREIVPPERIVWTGTLERDGNDVLTTVTFAELGAKTRLTVHQTFSIETDSTRRARVGWTQTLEYLAEFLKAARPKTFNRRKRMCAARTLVTEPADRVLKIERVFDAPPDLIFKAWTEPEHMMKWFGPRGFKSTVEKHDLRPGGQYRIHMLGPDGDHWSQGVFREIDPPKRLVMVGSWADAQGKLTRPETTLTLLFEDLGGKTKLTLHNAIFESTTARDLHQGGWNSALDCLAEYLATV